MGRNAGAVDQARAQRDSAGKPGVRRAGFVQRVLQQAGRRHREARRQVAQMRRALDVGGWHFVNVQLKIRNSEEVFLHNFPKPRSMKQRERARKRERRRGRGEGEGI